MDVAAMIDEARRELAAGNGKQAARLLTEAVYATEDPAVESEIRSLAEEGKESAGLFGKSRWDEIIRLADLRREKATAGTG